MVGWLTLLIQATCLVSSDGPLSQVPVSAGGELVTGRSWLALLMCLVVERLLLRVTWFSSLWSNWLAQAYLHGVHREHQEKNIQTKKALFNYVWYIVKPRVCVWRDYRKGSCEWIGRPQCKFSPFDIVPLLHSTYSKPRSKVLRQFGRHSPMMYLPDCFFPPLV